MKKFILVFVFLLFFFNFGGRVNAETFTNLPKIASNTALQQEREDLKASVSALKQQRKDLLSETKVAACQARQANITKRSADIVKRVTNQESVFTQISQRVESYYNEKMVPAGKTVPNYNSLVSDIATKEAAIAPLLATASADATSFSCDKDHPANQVLTFNADMKKVLTALETYRFSVRNLIVAVRTAAGVKDNTASGSATTQ